MFTRTLINAGLVLASLAAPAAPQLLSDEQVWDFENKKHLSRMPTTQTEVDSRIRVTWIDKDCKQLGRGIAFEGKQEGGWGSLLLNHFSEGLGTFRSRCYLVGDDDSLLALETRGAIRIATVDHDYYLFAVKTPGGIGAFLAADSEAVSPLFDLGLPGASACDLELVLFETEVAARARAVGPCNGDAEPVLGAWVDIGTYPLDAGADGSADGDDDDLDEETEEELHQLSKLLQGQFAYLVGASGLSKKETRVVFNQLWTEADLLSGLFQHDFFTEVTAIQADLRDLQTQAADANDAPGQQVALADGAAQIGDLRDRTEALLLALDGSTVSGASGVGGADVAPGPLAETVQKKLAMKNLKVVSKNLVAAQKGADKGSVKFIKKYVCLLQKALERLTATGYNFRGFKATRIAHLPLPALVKPDVTPSGGGGGGGTGNATLQADFVYGTGFTESLSASGADVTAEYQVSSGFTFISATGPNGVLSMQLGYDPLTEGAQVFNSKVFAAPFTGSLHSFNWQPLGAPGGFLPPPFSMGGSTAALSVEVEITQNAGGEFDLTFSGTLFGINGSTAQIDGSGSMAWTVTN